MKKIANILLVTAGFGLLAIVLGFLTSSPAPAQATSTPVNVTNTNANPVPTTAVGTALVAIRGTPTVMVGNGVTNPVQIHNVNDATTPFESRIGFNIDSGLQQNHAAFSVPQGKRLVIEHVSVYVTGPSGQKYLAGFTSSITANGQFAGGGLNWLVLEPQGTFPLITGPTDAFTSSQSMRLYTDSVPILIVTRTDSSGTATVDATISGYVVSQ